MRRFWALALASFILPKMKQAPQEICTYFVTAITAGRRSIFQVTATAELLIETIQNYRKQGKFDLYSYVVMRDHVHLLLTPAPDIPFEKAVQLIKGGFSFRLKAASTFGKGATTIAGSSIAPSTTPAFPTSIRTPQKRASGRLSAFLKSQSIHG